MVTDPMLEKLHGLESWLERTEDRRTLLPYRWAGRTLLVGVVLLSTVLALVRWPFAALSRRLAAGKMTPEREPAGPVYPPDLTTDKPIDVDREELTRVIGSGSRVLVDFWAEWCGPCLMMEGMLEEFADSNDNDCVVAKVNTVAHGDLAEEHGVKGLPMLILFEHGEEVRRHAGTLSEAKLQSFVERGESREKL